MPTKSSYYINHALQSITGGALLGYFTSNWLLGLGFTGVVFGLFWLYTKSPRFAGFAAKAERPANQARQEESITRAIVWGLACALLVLTVLLVVQVRYILPFQPAGFALIAGTLAGMLVLYIQRRKKK
jgi:hypothetical protein